MPLPFSFRKRRRYSAYPGYLRRNESDKSSPETGIQASLRRAYFSLLILFFVCTIAWLTWFFSEPPFPFYRVHPGDTIESLAEKFEVSVRHFSAINHLESHDRLPPGKLVLVPQHAAPGMTYVVRSSKETLSEVSQLYNISQWDLAKYNDLDSPLLQKGDILYLTQNRPNEYVVRPGDRLSEVAKTFRITENQLVQYNALNSESIQPGQILALYNNSSVDFRHLPVETVEKRPSSSNILALASKIYELSKKTPNLAHKPKISEEQFSPERATVVQESVLMPSIKPFIPHSDLPMSDVMQDFLSATALFKLFEQDVGTLEPLGNQLAGYTIVVDPGHGGHDPGAVVKTRVNGKDLYLVEDEFNYDISLRLYRLLKRYGADVFLTVLSPNNVIRENENNSSFANEKNEVYNDPSISFRPIGGRDGNNERIKIGEKFFAQVPAGKRIWISIHHDSSGDSPSGLVAVHLGAGSETYKLANSVIKTQKRGRIVEDKFFVLNGNPAPAAVLLEVRNPAIGEDKEMLTPSIREQDAQTICQAILSYAALQSELSPLNSR